MMIIRRSLNESIPSLPPLQRDIQQDAKNLWQSLTNPSHPTDAPTALEYQKEKLRDILGLSLASSLAQSAHRMSFVVVQFMALCNRSSHHGWLGPEQAGHGVAALQHAARCMILTEICESNFTDDSCAVLYSYLSTTENTSFCALSEIMSMAATANASEGRVICPVDWSTRHRPAWSVLTIGRETLSVRSFQEGVKRLVDKMSNLFHQDVMLGMKVSNARWGEALESTTDDLRSTRMGFGIASPSNNPALSSMRSLLAEHVCSNERLCQRFLTSKTVASDGSLDWNKHAARSWLAKVEDFASLLLTITHLLSGAPARAEELATASIINSEEGTRNIYWAAGQLMLMLRYHKSQNMHGSSRPTPRFFPQGQVADIALQYISIVKPLEALLAGIAFDARGASVAHRQYLFARNGKRVDGAYARQVFASHMHSVLGVQLTFRIYRHLQNCLCKAFIKYGFAVKITGEAVESEEASLLDLQAGHSERTGELLYGGTGLDHQDASYGKIQSYWLATNQWAQFCGFGVNASEWLAPPAYRGEAPATATAQPQVRDSGTADSHRRQFEEVIRPIAAENQAGNQAEDANVSDQDRSNEVIWSPSEPPPPPPPIRRQQPPSRNHQHQPPSFQDLKAALKLFKNDPNAQFKSEDQEQATMQVALGSRDCLIVMPTGSGKTLTYALPTWIESKDGPVRKVTVVVVPLISLTADLLRRFESSGIRAEEWKEDEESDASIILVSVEKAVTHSFMEFLNRLANLGRLSRIVIEEAHLALTAANYRPQFKKLGAIRPSAPTPFTMVTASLPPTMERLLSSSLGSQFQVLRSSTTRPNLKYGVVPVEEYDEHFSPQGSARVRRVQLCAVELMRRTLPRHLADNEDSRGILFCPTKAECEAVSEMLHSKSISSCFYHGGMNRTARSKAEGMWRGGKSLVMCATSAFGVGIDYSDVAVVMHLGHSNSLLDYSQESGRCGRGGKVSACIVVADDHYSAAKIGVSPVDLDPNAAPPGGRNPKVTDELLEFFKFINLKVDGEDCCRRRALQLHLDGRADSCLANNDVENCDICSMKEDAKEAREEKNEQNTELHQSPENASGLQLNQRSQAPQPIPHPPSAPAPPLDEAPQQRHHQQQRQVRGCQLYPLNHPDAVALLDQEKRQDRTYRDMRDLANILRQEPHSTLQAASSAAVVRRNQSEADLRAAMIICDRLKKDCMLCLVSKRKYLQHDYRACPLLRNRCLRCFEIGHGASQCSLTRYQCRADEPGCVRCGFYHANLWGNRCESNLTLLRDIGLSLWIKQPRWLFQHFPVARHMISIDEKVEYLYGRDSQLESARVVAICIKWYKDLLEAE